MFAEPRGRRARRTVFYRAGRRTERAIEGVLLLADGATIAIVNTVYDADRKTILHVPAEGAALPAAGARVVARIDWDLRYKRMRAHTALHLLSVVAALPGDRRLGRRRRRPARFRFGRGRRSTRRRSSGGSTR